MTPNCSTAVLKPGLGGTVFSFQPKFGNGVGSSGQFRTRLGRRTRTRRLYAQMNTRTTRGITDGTLVVCELKRLAILKFPQEMEQYKKGRASMGKARIKNRPVIIGGFRSQSAQITVIRIEFAWNGFIVLISECPSKSACWGIQQTTPHVMLERRGRCDSQADNDGGDCYKVAGAVK